MRIYVHTHEWNIPYDDGFIIGLTQNQTRFIMTSNHNIRSRVSGIASEPFSEDPRALRQASRQGT